jgi:hypothetical protein
MREELTAKMHSEFTISKQTEIKHKVFCALSDVKEFKYSIKEVCKLYGITEKDIDLYRNEYLDLTKG